MFPCEAMITFCLASQQEQQEEEEEEEEEEEQQQRQFPVCRSADRG